MTTDPIPPTLVGSRCVLRALRSGDAPALQRNADDEAVWRNLFEGFPRPYTLADAQAWCDGAWRGRGEAVWGITSQALALATDWTFKHSAEITRVYAPIFTWNEGSQGVARSCGYQLEGRMPQSAIKDGRVIDRVVYARYRRDTA